MNPDGKNRRACALLKVGAGQPARPMVERRPIFSYWAILMPHFRGVLLPPQNRSDESIQWAWIETEVDEPVSVTELATIRKRLSVALQSLDESLEDAAGQSAKAATFRATKERMDEIVDALVALPDGALAGFVARTDRGMLLHSWGLATPLPVQYLDVDLELAGRVMVAGSPAPGYKVLLDAAGGRRVAETTTDGTGGFCFSKVAAGSYRVRAVSRPPEVMFPEKGEAIELSGSSITTVEIQNEDKKRSTIPLPQRTSSVRYLWGGVAAVAALLAIAAYYVWVGNPGFLNASPEVERAAWEVNVAPRSVARRSAADAEGPKGLSFHTALEPNSNRHQALKAPRAGAPPPGEPADRGHSRATKDILAAQPTSGLPAEQDGMPAGGGGIAGAPAASALGGAPGGGQVGGPPGGAGAGSASGSSGASGGGSQVAASPTSTLSTSVPATASLVAQTSETPSPPASRPPGPPRSEVSSPSAAGAEDKKDKAGPAGSVGPDVPSAEHLPNGNASTAVSRDEVAAALGVNPEAPASAANSPIAELPDTDRGTDLKAREDKAPDKADAPSDESDDRRMQVQQAATAIPAALTVRGPESSLTRQMALRGSPWRRLLLRDAIVPTQPTRIGQDDAMNDLGARVLAEKKATIPRTMRDARIFMGVHIEFSVPFVGSAPRWEVADGDPPLVASVHEGAAEIGWQEDSPRGTYVLTSADGRQITCISHDPQGGINVSSMDTISHWPWIGIQHPSGTEERLDWQAAGAASLPSSWIKDDQWMNGRGRRLDLRSSTRKDETLALTLALVDAASGWALASKLEYQQVLPR